MSNLRIGPINITRAAGYAESADFKSAVAWETKACNNANQYRKAAYQSRLDLYKTKSAR